MNYLKEYQKISNLVPDKIIGPKTCKKMMEDFQIEKMEHFIHFISQVTHESNWFIYGRENLNYSEKQLRFYFKKYFSEEECAFYANDPEQIANRIYANRMGNGPEESGDGWKYRGAGSLQLTGKYNIEQYLEYYKLDNTDAIKEPFHYFNSGVFFFKRFNLWRFCDELKYENILNLSKMINLGSITINKKPKGLNKRCELVRYYSLRLAPELYRKWL